MTQPIKYCHNLQTGASPLAGTVNYLNTILYATLVTGFNTQAISSLVVTDNVATVTTSGAHGYVIDDVVNISGANESVFNDDFTILAAPSTTTFLFSVTTANATATGTLSAKIAPLGWDRVYSGTNKAVYRATTGNRIYLRVDDTNAQYSVMTAYEEMTGIDTGTNAVGPVYWKKSDASSTAARKWFIVGNKKTFYFFSAWYALYASFHNMYAFGEMQSLKPGDIWNTLLIGHGSSTITNLGTSISSGHINNAPVQNIGQYLTRNGLGVVNPVTFFKASASQNPYISHGGNISNPNPVNRGIHLFPIEIIEIHASGIYGYRGRLLGLYTSMELCNTYVTGEKLIIENKRYLLIVFSAVNASAGNVFLNIEDDWV